MRAVGLFFLAFLFLGIFTACGQTGSLYYPKPQKHVQRKVSARFEDASTSVKKNETVI